MKKLSKITLAKTYDVLSENEMKRVVGGMGSGSGIGDTFTFTCTYTWVKDDGTLVTSNAGGVHAATAEQAVSLLCENSTIPNCATVVTCV